MDKLSIKYAVEKAGWAEARIANGEGEALITVSYLHDSLLELAQMALSLKNGATEAKVLFMDEPSEHQFLVAVRGEELCTKSAGAAIGRVGAFGMKKIST